MKLTESDPVTSKRIVIQQCRLLSRLASEDIDRLEAMAIDCSYARGQTVFEQGDSCPGLFIVVRGQVRIVRNGANGKTQLLHLCGPKETFAEVAVFANMLAPADAIASEATRCVCLPAQPLQAALDESHQLCRHLLAGLSHWTRYFVEKLDDLVLHSAKGRTARYLCSLPADKEGRVRLPVSQKEVASHLNLSSETLSRVLRSFIKLGLIEQVSTREFVILQVDQLLALELDS